MELHGSQEESPSPRSRYATSVISTVAVGTDGSVTADEAVREAAEIARRFGAKLVLLSAFERSRAPGLRTSSCSGPRTRRPS